MTQGFYEQLGVEGNTGAAELRAAYARVAAGFSKRRRAVVEQGGDPTPLDLARSQLDEAWAVLSDPVRRRRYDAMRALGPEGFSADPVELWRRVAGALVPPGVAAAAELLRVTTNLKIGALPPDPGLHLRVAAAEPRRGHEEERTVTASAPRRPAASVIEARPPEPTRRSGLEARILDATPIAAPARTPARATDPEATQGTIRTWHPAPDDDVDELELSDPRRTGSSDPRVVPLPIAPQTGPSLRVFGPDDTPPKPAAVVPMVGAVRRGRQLSAEDTARLVDQHGHSGALLKAVREAKGSSLQEMSDVTRISVRYLEAIEADQHDRLPSATFVRGYLREIARQLGIDDEAFVAGYMRRIR